jgi:hypothetical protein
VNVSTFDLSIAGNRTVVRWFVGLGAGTQPDYFKQLDQKFAPNKIDWQKVAGFKS